MTEDSVITDEMRQAIGSLLDTSVLEIEKGKIKQYVRAMEETNPLYQDEDYAIGSRYHGLIAPPGLLITQVMSGGASYNMPYEDPLTHSVDAGEIIEFFQPIRPGDVLFLTRKLKSLSERESKSLGKMRMQDVEVTYTNQRGEVVARKVKSSFRY
ncbi:MaoC family dehydratase N-terminal domain-containing protein [Chloroflexota bacterium]